MYSVKNTAVSTKWVVTNFSSWIMMERNLELRKDLDLDVLLTDYASELCQVLCQFVKETRKEKGDEYTPKSLYLLVAGLQQSKKGRGSSFNVFSDPQFEDFRNVCDHEFRRLHRKGAGTEVKNTNAITVEKEASYGIHKF